MGIGYDITIVLTGGIREISSSGLEYKFAHFPIANLPMGFSKLVSPD